MPVLLLRLLPRSIADRIYGWVATNRYKWFGKTADALRSPAAR
jgi:predicted DCC family thiol-disulfide oxidoreductase YuxK